MAQSTGSVRAHRDDPDRLRRRDAVTARPASTGLPVRVLPAPTPNWGHVPPPRPPPGTVIPVTNRPNPANGYLPRQTGRSRSSWPGPACW